jgi:hypothetical protein
LFYIKEKMLLFLALCLIQGHSAGDCREATAAGSPLGLTARPSDAIYFSPRWESLNKILQGNGVLTKEERVFLSKDLLGTGKYKSAEEFRQVFDEVRKYGLGVLFLQLVMRWTNAVSQEYGTEVGSQFFLSILNRPGDERLYYEKKVKTITGTLLSPLPSLDDLSLAFELGYETRDIETKLLVYLIQGIERLEHFLISSLQDIEFRHVQFVQNYLSFCRDFTRSKEDAALNQVRFSSPFGHSDGKNSLLFRSFRERSQKNFVFPINLQAGTFGDFGPQWSWHTILGKKLMGGGLLLGEATTLVIQLDVERLKSFFEDESLEEIRNCGEGRVRNLFD